MYYDHSLEIEVSLQIAQRLTLQNETLLLVKSVDNLSFCYYASIGLPATSIHLLEFLAIELHRSCRSAIALSIRHWPAR